MHFSKAKSPIFLTELGIFNSVNWVQFRKEEFWISVNPSGRVNVWTWQFAYWEGRIVVILSGIIIVASQAGKSLHKIKEIKKKKKLIFPLIVAITQ